MYEYFDHTADLGLCIRAPDLETLFVEAARALFGAIVEDLGSINASRRVDIHLTGDEREFLLFDWLKELLYRFDVEHLLFSRFEVHLGDGVPGGTGVSPVPHRRDAGATFTLTAAAWGEPLDPSRHELLHEVKAITYHGLRVEQTAGGWLAEVIVDI